MKCYFEYCIVLLCYFSSASVPLGISELENITSASIAFSNEVYAVNFTDYEPLNSTKRMRKQHDYDLNMAAAGEVPLHIMRTRHAVPITFSGNEIYNKLHGMNVKLISSLGPIEGDPLKHFEVIARPFIQRGQGTFHP